MIYFRNVDRLASDGKSLQPKRVASNIANSHSHAGHGPGASHGDDDGHDDKPLDHDVLDGIDIGAHHV